MSKKRKLKELVLNGDMSLVDRLNEMIADEKSHGSKNPEYDAWLRFTREYSRVGGRWVKCYDAMLDVVESLSDSGVASDVISKMIVPDGEVKVVVDFVTEKDDGSESPLFSLALNKNGVVDVVGPNKDFGRQIASTTVITESDGTSVTCDGNPRLFLTKLHNVFKDAPIRASKARFSRR